ncbi:MAG TPA: alpha/beta fold hydrolase [Motilibacteraceae bacterium]|nr:alpha/beta fold hydrolase [Motilibacteraceae bacterium]
MPFVTAPDGVRLHYELREPPALASAPPVLLLHGFAGSAVTNWARTGVVDPLLAAGRPVVLADARGHGRSDKPREVSSYAGSVLVDDAMAVLEALPAEAVDVVGYSMGAFTAARMSHRRMRSVVLAGVGDGVLAARDADSQQAVAAAMLADDPAEVRDRLGRRLRRYAEWSGGDLRALAAAQRGASFAQPATVVDAGLPTLVLAGERDDVVGRPAELARRIPGARLALVSGTHMTAPAQPAFAAALVDFLEDVDAGRAAA